MATKKRGSKKRNPQDLTRRNLIAMKKKMEKMQKELDKLKQQMKKKANK